MAQLKNVIALRAKLKKQRPQLELKVQCSEHFKDGIWQRSELEYLDKRIANTTTLINELSAYKKQKKVSVY